MGRPAARASRLLSVARVARSDARYARGIRLSRLRPGSGAGVKAMATKKQIEPEWIRKITIKSVTGGITPEVFEKLVKVKSMRLMTLYGIAGSFKAKLTDYGESIGFLGEFEAEDIATGATFRSMKAYLPKALEEMLWGILSSGGEGARASFACEIGAQYDPEAATKYVYSIKPLVNPVAGDGLALLKAQAHGKALPAPKAEKAKE
jgi:hypothetical protein